MRKGFLLSFALLGAVSESDGLSSPFEYEKQIKKIVSFN